MLTRHVFDKVRALDLTLAEFELLLGSAEVVEQTPLRLLEVKRVLLVVRRARPLHVVVVVDGRRHEERIVTVYEPDPERWSADFRERRRT